MKEEDAALRRTCTVKTRLTEEERKEFAEMCETHCITQSGYLRQAILHGKVETTFPVQENNEMLVNAISAIVAQYGKIGSNLNQIARHLNMYGPVYEGITEELRNSVSDLNALKYEVMKTLGEAYGNHKTY